MPASTVFVNKSGNALSGARVVISFESGGVTPSATTDRNGQAIIQHDGRGAAKVIVNGSTVGRFQAPGTFVADI